MPMEHIEVNISEADFQTACYILNASIRKALADPIKKAEYEEWKRQRRTREAAND